LSTHLKYIDLSLTRIRKVAKALDNIENKIPNIIHIAGTNGKGSTLSFLKTILEYNGYSVNTFTSPHLVHYNERFYILGKYISNHMIDEYKHYLNSIDDFKNLTIFEATTIIGFLAFYKNKADFTILETGLGGRLDATNIITNPLLNIITKLDFDHMNFLGDTIESITHEKAGIIKPNALVLSDYQHNSSYEILKEKSKNNIFISGGLDYKIDETKEVLYYNNEVYNLAHLSLKGTHQLYNSSLAIVSALNIPNIKLNKENIQQALSNTKWLGRLQKVENLYNIHINNATVYLDGAHNPSGARILNDFIKKQYNKNPKLKIHIILGMLRKKDMENTLKSFDCPNIMFYPIQNNNTMDQDYPHDFFNITEIAHSLDNLNLPHIINPNIIHNLEYIKDNFHETENLIIICGSLYLLGHILTENPKIYDDYLN
jgi:dihydrofolate synthase/folylpolyglutamate synthase